jgi:hypothetical protein
MKGIWVVENLIKTSPGWIKRRSVSSCRYTKRTFRCILRYIHAVPNSLYILGITPLESAVRSNMNSVLNTTRRADKQFSCDPILWAPLQLGCPGLCVKTLSPLPRLHRFWWKCSPQATNQWERKRKRGTSFWKPNFIHLEELRVLQPLSLDVILSVYGFIHSPIRHEMTKLRIYVSLYVS